MSSTKYSEHFLEAVSFLLKLKFMILSECLLCMFINLLHRRDAGFFGNTCRHMEVDAVFTDPRV